MERAECYKVVEHIEVGKPKFAECNGETVSWKEAKEVVSFYTPEQFRKLNTLGFKGVWIDEETAIKLGIV